MNKTNTTMEETAPTDPSFGAELFNHIKTGIIATVVLGVLVSGVYPLIVWAIAQAVFNDKANGSLIDKDGQRAKSDADAVGSSLIGQGFSAPQYFHPRPSAAGSGYDATASQGSNLGPTSAKLMYGTTKLAAFIIFAADKAHSPVVTLPGRVQAIAAAVTKTSITVTADASAGAKKTTYALDPSVADPNTVVNYHGRTIHATTIPAGSIVELKLNDKTPPAVTAINVVDQENDGTPSSVDTTANKITLNDTAGTVINFDPKNTVFVVNGAVDTNPPHVTTDMTIHAVVATVYDNDGIADRAMHYCQDNNIAYTSSVPDSAFTDADGIDDVKLINAFNAASEPKISPKDPNNAIPADAVTASGSGLDPHISKANAAFQATRVASARNVPVEKVNALIAQYTDGASLGFLGEAGVNVLRLNLALDKQYPVPAAAPTTAPATQP